MADLRYAGPPFLIVKFPINLRLSVTPSFHAVNTVFHRATRLTVPVATDSTFGSGPARTRITFQLSDGGRRQEAGGRRLRLRTRTCTTERSAILMLLAAGGH